MTEEENKKAWNFAIGLASIDGIKPSDFMLGLIEKEIRGEITGAEIRKALTERYTKK